MPIVEVDPDELRRLVSEPDTSDDQLKSDLFGLGLEFEGVSEDGDFVLEFAPDRLDRLSVEGVARSLRYHYGKDRGVYIPSTNNPDWTIVVEDVPEERPYVTGAVIRGISLDEQILASVIQLQEKLHATIGRDRAKGAIGIHDLTMLKGAAVGDSDNQIVYTGIDPEGDSFVPLDSDAEMTPADVIRDHPVGTTYGPLLESYERFPAIYDDIGLFSFPPVINGRRTEVTTESRDLLIEMTGTDQWTIDRMLAIVCYALDARGGTVEEVTVEYGDESVRRPDLMVDEKTVTHERIERILGVDIGTEDVTDLLERSGLSVESLEQGDAERAYRVGVPPYRVDVLHPLDVIDDIGRAYGFNDLVPRYPDVSTVGSRHDRAEVERSARNVLVGLGYQDLLNFHLISEEANFERLRITEEFPGVGGGVPIRIEAPYSAEYEMVRTWALPSLMMVLENNTHRAYPQHLSEIGLAATVDLDASTRVSEWRAIAGVCANTEAGYDLVKSHLQTIATRFGVSLSTPAISHPSFIEGRVASVEIDGESVGVIGEVHPEILVGHDLEVPVAAFEFRLAALR